MRAVIAQLPDVTPVPARWSRVETRRLSTERGVAVDAISVGPSGRGFIAYRAFRKDYTPTAAYRTAAGVRAFDASGRLGWPFKLRSETGVLPNATASSGRTVVIGAPSRGPKVITASDLTPTGKLLHTRRIAVPDRDDFPGGCVGASGDALVVWRERRAKGPQTLWMARRPAGGRLATRVRLTTATPWDYSCSMAADGRWVLAAAVRQGGNEVPRLRVWTGFVGRAERHRVELGDAPWQSIIRTAIDGAGRSYVLWRSQLPDSGFGTGPNEPYRLRAASIAPDGRTPSPTQLIATGHGGGGDGALAASPTGGAVLEVASSEYTEGFEDGPPGVAVTTAGPDGAFTPLTAPIAGAVYGGPVAYAADGTAIVTWTGAANHLLAAPIIGGAAGPVEETGLDARNGAYVSASPGGQPRLFGIVSSRDGARLQQTTRLAP